MSAQRDLVPFSGNAHRLGVDGCFIPGSRQQGPTPSAVVHPMDSDDVISVHGSPERQPADDGYVSTLLDVNMTIVVDAIERIEGCSTVLQSYVPHIENNSYTKDFLEDVEKTVGKQASHASHFQNVLDQARRMRHERDDITLETVAQASQECAASAETEFQVMKEHAMRIMNVDDYFGPHAKRGAEDPADASESEIDEAKLFSKRPRRRRRTTKSSEGAAGSLQPR